ncbi:MAG: methionyl-tRNA formyltransferase [Spirochaetia bacterium]|jgi:methionyl-tRNA formyltransferase|nr:methionyl-tRNA formyltransferase [Spirochaetia bacterium]
MKILFAGTPAIAVPALRAAAASHTVVGVLTNPDSPAGRGRGMSASPVKEAALELGLPVLQPEKLDAAFRGAVRGLGPELLVAFAYGRIFGPRFLECFPRGGINVHPSLLPRHRGPSPINAAILEGDRETGLTIQSLALEMDAGDIILQEGFPLTGRETAGSLALAAAEKGAALLARALDLIAEGRESRRPQDPAAATYCGLLGRGQGKIGWGNSAAHIERMVRAFDPWPGAWTGFRGAALRILAAEALDRAGAGRNPEEGIAARPSARAGRNPEDRIAARPCARDCSGNPAGSAEGASEELERKARFFAEQKRRPEDEDTPGKVLGVDKQKGILVQTGDGLLAVRCLQLASKKAMDFASFMNGARGFTGSVLGDA